MRHFVKAANSFALSNQIKSILKATKFFIALPMKYNNSFWLWFCNVIIIEGGGGGWRCDRGLFDAKSKASGCILRYISSVVL